jgi:hypothetical protein
MSSGTHCSILDASWATLQRREPIRAASIQATAAAGALAAGALAYIGAVRLARGDLAFSPCRAMGVRR